MGSLSSDNLYEGRHTICYGNRLINGLIISLHPL